MVGDPRPSDQPVTHYAANYIPGLQAAFPSANSALAFLKEVGFGVRRQNFLWEWGAQLREQANQPQHFTAALGSLPAASSITERRAPSARGFHYVVQHLIEDADTGELYYTYGGYRNPGENARLVTYGEAIAGAEQAFLEGQLADERYPQGRLLGSIVTAVRRYLPELPELDEVTG